MNLGRTFTSTVIVAALLGTAAPAGAQERKGQEPRARQTGQSETQRHAVPRSSGQRRDGDDRNASRSSNRYRPERGADRRAYPDRDDRRAHRNDDQRAYRNDDQRAYRNDDQRAYRNDDQRAYRNDDRRAYSYSDDRRDDAGARAVPRPYYSRPYFYSRPYVRPYGYVPYQPFYFSQPYYTFHPDLDIGFGLWIGSPVPYPYGYLGGYRPRVFGYPYGYDAGSVSIYGGVSFDLQPSDADLFLDGEYVGRVGDFTPYSEPLTLTPGVHRIAVQRDGFRPMEWEVRIEPGQVIPYRGEMERY